MKRNFDPDDRYPDCLIPDTLEEDLNLTTTNHQAQSNQDPAWKRGYFDAKKRKVDTNAKQKQYWEGVLAFISWKNKVSLGLIEDQPKNQGQTKVNGPRKKRKSNLFAKEVSNEFPIGWKPPVKYSRIMTFNLLSPC